MSGKLYVVATPIGNLSDFSPRAVETLKSVDFIAAEDTRVGIKLLNRFDIHTPQISYFEHNRRQKGEQIAARLLAGENCALITNAGTPAISDPGTDLVSLCAAESIEVRAVPGCCAAAAALSISGIECGRFTFEGFLSTTPKSRKEHLRSVRDEVRTMVFYEAPHKLLRTLSDMLECWGDREVSLCREVTKIHEEVRRTTLSEAMQYYTDNPPRGEFVLVIAGQGQKAEDAQPPDLLAEVTALIEGGASLKDAVQQVSRTHNAPKNRLYQQALETLGKK